MGGDALTLRGARSAAIGTLAIGAGSAVRSVGGDALPLRSAPSLAIGTPATAAVGRGRHGRWREADRVGPTGGALYPPVPDMSLAGAKDEISGPS